MGMPDIQPGVEPGFAPDVRPGAADRLGGYAPVGSILEQMGTQISGQTESTFDASGYPEYTAPAPTDRPAGTFDWGALLQPDAFTNITPATNQEVETEVGKTVEKEAEWPFTPKESIWKGETQPTERDFVMPWTALTEAPGLPKGVYIRKADLGVLRQGYDKIMPLLWKYKLVEGGQGILKGQGGPDWTEETAPDWVKELPSWAEWAKNR